VAYLGFGKGGAWRARRARAGTLFAFEHLMEVADSPIFLKFGNAENHSIISDAISHGDFNRILYRYEKKTIKHC